VKSQKHKLYSCEDILFNISTTSSSINYEGETYQLDAGMITTVEKVNNFFHTITTSPYTIANFGVIDPCSLVIKKNLDRKSYYSPMTKTIHIAQRQWAMTKQVVLHEFAHHIVDCTHPKGVEDAHGVEFQKVYLKLMEIYLSEGNSRLLEKFLNG